ncbi:MAG TPA: choice-of-anchor tandem repeat GloVer-containing protein [Chthonomonadaceae bacterium]|nr:choice-of-anchor tandem repeat GloVer-containing protein [Chthonomonadaceae bacterium]
MFRHDASRHGKKAVRSGSHLVLLQFLLSVLILASARHAQAQVVESILHTFNSYADGADPSGSLIQGQDGAYYGTTFYGGPNNFGTIYKIDSSGKLTTIHSFSGPDGDHPACQLIQAGDGTLYGTASGGGSNYDGTVFRLNPDGTGFTVLHHFHYSDGDDPIASVSLGSDGKLYGTTPNGGAYGDGTVFQLSTDGAIFNMLHSFSGGAYLHGGVIQASDGKLYGTTLGGGAKGNGSIFQLSTDGTIFNTIHSFNNSDGNLPLGTLIQANDGLLYGTTVYGGSYGDGTVYQVSTDGAVFNAIHSFHSSDGDNPYAGVIQGNDGKLYGTTPNGGAYGDGTVFQVSTDGTGFNSLHSFNNSTEGYVPLAGVIQGSDGLLHGTTYYGPYSLPRNIGAIYSLDTAGTTFTTVFKFNDGFVDGAYPNYGRLALGKDGDFYATTQSGGPSSYGTLFKISRTGKETILHLFGDGDGYQPMGGVAFDGKGNIFGTTGYGGSTDYGTVFEYSQVTSALTTLYSFSGAAGWDLTSGVVLAGAKLYGTTFYGGQVNLGVVYEISLPTATTPLTFQILHSFSGPDGLQPWGALTLGNDRNLYGATTGGGASGYGTIFKITPRGVFTLLHSFSNTDGAYPFTSLLQGRDGMLYGVTWQGGTYSYGNIFKISTDGSVFTILHSFNGADGAGPTGALLLASDGLLYGTTLNGGINNTGTAFKLSTNGSVFSSLYNFGISGMDGAYPLAGLTEGPDGNLYGTTEDGGINPGFNTAIAGAVYCLQTQLPLIKNFSPTSGSTSAGTIVTIKGVNLTSPTVTIAGVSQTVLAGGSATSLKFQLNAATPVGSYPIVVTASNGTVTSAKKFTVGP